MRRSTPTDQLPYRDQGLDRPASWATPLIAALLLLLGMALVVLAG